MHAQQKGDSAPLSAKATLGVSVDVMEGMEGIKEGVCCPGRWRDGTVG